MTADLRERLQISLGAAYTVEDELGGGGMSRVFVALDAQLGRKVVVKILSPELAAGVNSQRFKREIRVVASLQQANIVPLLAAGETGGLPFYTMPFVEGRSLRDRLARESPLPIPEAVSILRDVARALTYAHERGVVHRDIKPENVLLSGEAAVVTDFGIAKALAAARDPRAEIPGEAPSPTLTTAGIGVGTPAYMAPEQASGDPSIDHRADLYSFGCLAFELLTGRTPFHDLPVHQVVASHFGVRPPAVTELRADVPAPLVALVARCLEKEPADRPRTAREVLQTLDSDPTSSAIPARRRSARALLVAAPLVAAALALILLVPRGARDGTPAAVGVPLALVPFANASGDTAQDFRADGLTDALHIEVKKLPGLALAARSATNRFRGQRDLDPREVGRVLDVAWVLHGTFRSDGRTQRVIARLSRASDGEDVWQDDFDHDAGDVFAAEDSIRHRVVAALQQHLRVALGSTATGTSSRGTTDTAAYNLYQRGQFLLGRRGPGVALAAEHFEQAIARDPGFARAHAALSATLEILPNFSDTTFVDVHERATAAARRALALDSTLSEAHTALALAHMHDFQWDSANARFRTALRMDPADPAAHLQYARMLVYTGRSQEAHEAFQRAKAADPTSALISSWLAASYMAIGRTDDGFREIDSALEIDSMNPPIIFFGAGISAARGRVELARRLLARTPPIPVWRSAAAQVYAAIGDRDTVLRILREVEAQPTRSFRHSTLATLALVLGDTARALDEFERAMDAREFWPSAPILSHPTVDPLRGSARFAALLRRANLNVALFTSPTGGRPAATTPPASTSK
ncbi:MAG TPA: protein kinase [Gemmatimonadaceae bacterium]|nr:protein kinase [Gemmatimonadaceae bacterium]